MIKRISDFWEYLDLCIGFCIMVVICEIFPGIILDEDECEYGSEEPSLRKRIWERIKSWQCGAVFLYFVCYCGLNFFECLSYATWSEAQPEDACEPTKQYAPTRSG
jgi:hypothetical protein